jgi:ion channel
VISKLLFAWCLMSLCVASHAVGIGGAVRWLRRVKPVSQRLRSWTWIFIRVAGWIILLHLLEIVLWGLLYAWQQAMPDAHAAFYFSAVTYTTTGYGDLVLPDEWRLVGAVEALTGILMCGWSTGFFFVVVSRMFEARSDTEVAR